MAVLGHADAEVRKTFSLDSRCLITDDFDYVVDHCVYRFVALKIVKSAEHYTEAAMDEIKVCWGSADRGAYQMIYPV